MESSCYSQRENSEGILWLLLGEDQDGKGDNPAPLCMGKNAHRTRLVAAVPCTNLLPLFVCPEVSCMQIKIERKRKKSSFKEKKVPFL